MKVNFEQRTTEPEWMDDFTRGGGELQEALRHLRRLNLIFGAAGPAVYGVNRLWKAIGSPHHFTLLDVGSGSGDINRRILKWADQQGVEIRVILADVTEEAREEAGRLFRNESRVTFIKQDLLDLPANLADIVTASQIVHHFDSEKLPSVIERMLEISRAGLVINDIHRHWIPWAAVWIATRLISGNRYIRHDGPLSVAKSFRSSDFRELARQLGLSKIHYRWRPLFRYSVVIPKQREGLADEEGS